MGKQHSSAEFLKLCLREAGMQEGDPITLAVKNGAIVGQAGEEQADAAGARRLKSRLTMYIEKVEWGKPKGAEAW